MSYPAPALATAALFGLSWVVSPAVALADPFDWSGAAVVHSVAFPQSAHQVEVRMGVAEGIGDIELVARWRVDGEDREATLLRTMCDDTAWAFHLAPDGSLVAQHGPCSRYDDHQLRVHHTWRFDPADGFVDETVGEHSPYAVGRQQMDDALAAGHLADALAALEAIGTTENGGHTDESTELYQALFDGFFAHAERSAEAGDLTLAAEVMTWVLRRGIVCDPAPEAIVIAAEPLYGGCSANALAPTPENVAHLEATAEWLEATGNNARAETIRGALR